MNISVLNSFTNLIVQLQRVWYYHNSWPEISEWNTFLDDYDEYDSFEKYDFMMRLLFNFPCFRCSKSAIIPLWSLNIDS